MTMRKDVVIGEATVADELAFSALPVETQQLVKRLYGEGTGGFTEDDMIQAYEAGFEDAAENFEPPRAWRTDAVHFVKDYKQWR